MAGSTDDKPHKEITWNDYSSLDDRIILKCTLDKYILNTRIGMTCLRIGFLWRERQVMNLIERSPRILRRTLEDNIKSQIR